MTILSEPVARPRVAHSRKRSRIDQTVEPAIAGFSASSSWSEPALSGMAILDALRHGVMVVSTDFQLVYRNLKAQDIYAAFGSVTATLPDHVTEACRRFMAERWAHDSSSSDPFVVECYPVRGHKFNLQIAWMAAAHHPDYTHHPDYILITIEDCYADMMVLWRREQARHGFTEREIQIWTLLHLECTYQEIAAQLKIRVNTVKTHVKNLNAKRRCHPQSSRLWFFPGQC